MNSIIEQATITDIQCSVCGCKMEVISQKGYGLVLQCPGCKHEIPLEEHDSG